MSMVLMWTILIFSSSSIHDKLEDFECESIICCDRDNVLLSIHALLCIAVGVGIGEAGFSTTS